MVQIFDDGQLIATHARLAAGKQTEPGHYPPEKIAFQQRTPDWCRARAAEIGEHCVAVVNDLLEVPALFRLRAAQGVVSLADRHGPIRLEQACAKAMAVGDPSLRTVKGILAAGLETDPPSAASGDGGAAAFLHGPSRLFRNVVAMPNSTQPTVVDTSTTTVGSDEGVGA